MLKCEHLIIVAVYQRQCGFALFALCLAALITSFASFVTVHIKIVLLRTAEIWRVGCVIVIIKRVSPFISQCKKRPITYIGKLIYPCGKVIHPFCIKHCFALMKVTVSSL